MRYLNTCTSTCSHAHLYTCTLYTPDIPIYTYILTSLYIPVNPVIPLAISLNPCKHPLHHLTPHHPSIYMYTPHTLLYTLITPRYTHIQSSVPPPITSLYTSVYPL